MCSEVYFQVNLLLKFKVYISDTLCIIDITKLSTALNKISNK